MRQWIKWFFEKSLGGMYIPTISVTDILEILIIAFIVYEIMLWIKNTKAWMLLKGILMLGGFIIVAAILRMNTILFLAKASINVLAVATVVVFQPELRRALEKLGEKNFITNISWFDRYRQNLRFSKKTMESLVEASFAMGSVKTGALIVVEQLIQLSEFEKTGIPMDCLISKQILLNIFEHNTPLHDGAIIVRGDRIVSATCYLPLSDNMQISKALGTRHRAALGMSEVSDALVIVVSEETGQVSLAIGGQLIRDVSPEYLEKRLKMIQFKNSDGKKFPKRKGEQNEEK